jgi:hypothetical protein
VLSVWIGWVLTLTVAECGIRYTRLQRQEAHRARFESAFVEVP